MARSAIEGLIARLTDSGALSEQIVWRAGSIAECREVIARVGQWQPSPDGGGNILLSDSAHVVIFDDAPPWHADDDLNERIDGATPRVGFFIGPRGGLRRMGF